MDALLAAYTDPLFVWFPLVTSAISMGAFLAFAVPLTWLAWTDPPWFARYRIQSRRGRADRIIGPSLRWWVLDNALMTALSGDEPRKLLESPDLKGRLVESAVGAYLANAAAAGRCRLFYWRERSLEVDFVVERAGRLLAIEVKSGRRRDGLPGIGAFLKAYPKARPLLVGADGIAVGDFLSADVADWFK